MSPAEILSLHKLRKTPARLAIVHFLQESNLPQSENDLRDKMKESYDRITFYRSIQTLMDTGVVHRIVADNTTIRYALNYCNLEHHEHKSEHVHFFCTKCGKVECLKGVVVEQYILPDGYQVDESSVVIKGLCGGCSTKGHLHTNTFKMKNEFDRKARDWDKNSIHLERSEAIAKAFLEMVPVDKTMEGLEYGAGTGLLSFLLSDKFSEITLMDNSEEMVKVMHEKVAACERKNLMPLLFDLEKEDYFTKKFDCIFSQMVLHHISDIKVFLNKCYKMLHHGGYLVVADLFSEDGSFHDSDAKVHLGFNPSELAKTLELLGFKSIEFKTCFDIKRANGRVYPIFLLVANI